MHTAQKTSQHNQISIEISVKEYFRLCCCTEMFDLKYTDPKFKINHRLPLRQTAPFKLEFNISMVFTLQG